ncbi:hypothetical protein BGZ80_004746 [Entomortierella chlamydospora]|uniref:Uncharacterized protein n=1 Tax=Entomortierella chlamydospora TaxID=101097 RepID=A0A9P6N196_9FUNG|nr:hypothetical protein BGZ80_004746 [Entomortierella chlamydospora]
MASIGGLSWCDSQGWGPLNENGVSLVPCFQNTVLLGLPAVAASIVFLLRATYLRRHGIQHHLGNTFAYWPSQFALLVATVTLLANLLIASVDVFSDYFAYGSLLVAWILAIRLNRFESQYEIRSSSFIFVFELYSIAATFITLYSFYVQQSERQDLKYDPHKFLVIYFFSILSAFFFEALPRGCTHVQLQSSANAHDKANLFSRWVFHYMQPIISLGYRRPLTPNDIRDTMPKKINTDHGYQLLSKNWDISKKDETKTPSLVWVIAKTFFLPFIIMVSIHLVASAIQFTLPVLIGEILKFIESDDPNEPKLRGAILALGMLFVNITVSILTGQHQKQNVELGLEIRNALISLIYRKALVLSPDSRNKATIGSITNHMSTDAEKWTKDLVWVPYWITVPFEILVATVMLYRILGWSVLCGLSMVVIITPIQGWAGQFFDDAMDAKGEAMDSRVRLMSELLSNIKNIKMYGYEPAFKKKVETHRSKEIRLLRKCGVVLSFLSIVFTCMPLFMAFVSFAVYASVGGPGFSHGDMNARVVFVSVSLFGLLNRPIGVMSNVMETTISLRVSCRRIQKFLLMEEIDSDAVRRSPTLPEDNSAPLVLIENATFAWSNGQTKEDESDSDVDGDDETTALLIADTARSNEPTLVDISLSFARRTLNAIVGRVGQGKSSLLSAIIGDMYKREGNVKVFGSIAYTPQHAWIINATVRDNIVFGKKFDQEKYDQILFASGLLPDLEILAAGDQTEIGERGINLSGGQKQRVSLARAAYQDADIYLLDDPLSAVDAHVDQHLWDNLLGPNGLLKDKTRILVTHGIHRLEQVDHILVIKDGKIAEAGRFSHLMAAKDTFYRLISEFSISHGSEMKSQQSSLGVGDESEAATVVEGGDSPNDDEDDEDDVDGSLIEKEGVRATIVGWETFKVYYNAMSIYYFVVSILLFIVWEAFQQGVPVWLEYWARVAETTTHSPFYFLVVYAVLVFVFIAVDVYLTYVVNVHACPAGWNAPTHHIRNPCLRLRSPCYGLGPVDIMLRRLESILKSPLYQHFGETLNGISSIRAMNINSGFVERNAINSDLSANAHYAAAMTNRWLNIRLEVLTSIVVFVAALMAVWNRDTLSPSMAGLALSGTVYLTYNTIWTLRSYCDLSAELVAVERVHEYSNRHTEAPEFIGTRLPQGWPQKGHIVFKNYSARYREGLDLVIKNISFKAQPGEHIGIVGRTGAGKSSLTLALFRIIEAANSYWARASAQEELSNTSNVDNLINGGSIEIDGIDISTLGLRELRQHLSIIPQDPTLFSGTVRENLDPFNEATDAELWEALERAHLKSHIASLEGGLSYEVAQNGENFSVGQRSLICLARALLRKTKILVLDEATAAVDVETDELIQKTIRKEFKDRTILTIAHRIKTIMDSDKILVLEEGRIQEYDTPAVLLHKKGLFYRLAEQAGEVR